MCGRDSIRLLLSRSYSTLSTGCTLAWRLPARACSASSRPAASRGPSPFSSAADNRGPGPRRAKLGRLGRRAAPTAPQSTAAANQTPDASAEPARGCGGPRAGTAKTPSIPPRPAAAAPAVPACGRPGVGGRKALRANEGDGRHEFQSHRRRTETARTKRTAEMSAKRIAGAETLSEICLEVRN